MTLPRVRLFGGYAELTRRNLPREVGAGVTLTALAVPLNIGYAQIAGLPPAAGLYALILPAVLFALLSTSRQLVAAPDAAAAALVASSLGGLAAAGSGGYLALAAAQALIGALFFVVFWFFKLGFVADFLSEAVLIGFVGGLALEIMLSQAKKMTGVKTDAEEFFKELWQFVTRLDQTHGWTLLLAAGTVAVVLLGRRLAPAIPWALVAIVAATLAVVLGDLDTHGVAVLGKVEGGLPAFRWPAVPDNNWVSLMPSALALTLVALAEGLLLARQMAQRGGYPVDANQELLAFGAANVAAGVSGSFTIGSSASRTAAMDQGGSRTQLPALVTAVLTGLLLLFGTGLLEKIPDAALGAVVAVAVAPIIGVGQLRTLWTVRRAEFLIATVCMVAVLLLGPIQGVIIAFLMTAVDFMRRAASPHTKKVPGPAETDVTLHFSAPLFFANAETFRERVEQIVTGSEPPPRRIVIACEAVTDIDYTGSKELRGTVEWCRDRDVRVALTDVNGDLRALLGTYGLLSVVEIVPPSPESEPDLLL
ncbi:SulP family inorganic anion transporter [Streptomyces sp. NBC_00094]|uniref:SulP family inorganic anion transporter n=1 Tax=Streptomyces sp. NBC_00094 TaxID=2903620 RepID=UPI00224FD7DC|nr:solute carrier family 23 protein [Streptomyces sp. NBC_00094]MCX5390549.1 SulP family inorganic anion transporter [Streptomyces sp. NBC_00094]